MASFRIAIREEGTFVNAYVVLNETTKEQLLVATIHKFLLDTGIKFEPSMFDMFTSLVAAGVKAMVEDVTGAKVLNIRTQEPPADEISRNGAH